MEDKRVIKMPHHVIMEDRRLLTISGVTDIDSFDEQTVVIYTDIGELMIKGFNLHINKIDVENGDLILDGEIYSLSYSDQQPQSGGFLSRLFR